MSTAFTLDWNDPASIARIVAQVTAIADICDQLSISIDQAARRAPARPALQMRLITAATALSLAAEDCRDAGQQLAALVP
jgi:hypothetical protein